ncbi:MAG: WD40 repeat domain-containing protein [Candidatus Eremiobacteraeota bacterium]|nr:WD40 repeat domain-containing protein [Candidatus Eremiobacteraeota bacterium]MCW5870538.1 WD40 repeat domain-containing protein [Candidatus Eremiobacteraeota bacterium]
MKRLLCALLLTGLAQAQPGTHGVCWSGDGKQIAVGRAGKVIEFYDAGSGRRLGRVKAPGPAFTSRSFSPDSSYEVSDDINRLVWSGGNLISGGEDGEVRLWQAGKVRAKAGVGYEICGVALSRDGALMAYSDSSTRYLDSSVRAYRIEAGKLQEIALEDTGEPESTYGAVQLSPGGRYLALANATSVWINDLQDKQVTRLDFPSKNAFGAKPKVCLSDEELAVYAENRLELRPLKEPKKVSATLPIQDADEMSFLPQGLSVHAGQQLLTIEGGAITHKLKFSQRPDAYSPDGTRLAVESPGRVKVYDRKTARLLLVLKL